jgi:DNA-directed RNA polymerase subunit beta
MKPEDLKDIGLHNAFKTVFPIEDYNEKASLEYIGYRFDRPKYEAQESRLKGYTYVAPLYVTFRLVIWDTESGAERTIRDVKEQEVYFGEIPLMTPNGSFIVNGTERVIVNQLHRSPGVFFDQVKNKDSGVGRSSFSARIVPHDGRWMDFEFDSKDILHVRIDRKKKFLVTVLLKALGYGEREIMHYFYPIETIHVDPKGMSKNVNHEVLPYQRSSADIIDPGSKEVLVKKGRRFVRNIIEKLKRANVERIPIDPSELADKFAADDIVDKKTGEVIVNFNELITEPKLDQIKSADVKEFRIFYIDNVSVVASLRSTILADKIKTREDSITEIYKKVLSDRPAHAQRGRVFLRQHVFQSGHLQALSGRASQNKLQIEPRHPGRSFDPYQGRHNGDGQIPSRAERRQGDDRRHRPPWEQEGADCRGAY